MLKLRVTALEAQKKKLEEDLHDAIAEGQVLVQQNELYKERLQNTEKVCSALQLENLRERNSSAAAIQKVIQLENQLQDLQTSEYSTDDE